MVRQSFSRKGSIFGEKLAGLAIAILRVFPPRFLVDLLLGHQQQHLAAARRPLLRHGQARKEVSSRAPACDHQRRFAAFLLHIPVSRDPRPKRRAAMPENATLLDYQAIPKTGR
jgi:hypothetical protein